MGNTTPAKALKKTKVSASHRLPRKHEILHSLQIDPVNLKLSTTSSRAHSIICRAGYKTKTKGPLFKKQGKKVPLSTLKYRAFSFLPWSLSIPHDFFICSLMLFQIKKN